MKIFKRIFPFVLLAVIVTAAAACAMALPKNTHAQPTNTPTGAAQPKNPGAAPQPELAAGSTAFPLPTAFPGVQWSETPPCANQPQAADIVTQSLMAPSLHPQPTMDYRRAVLLSPKLAELHPAEVEALLAPNNAAASGQKALVGLAINLATGRLNRATEVSFAGLPEIKTAGDLLDQMEGAATGTTASPALIQAARDLQSGKGITQPVCAHLVMTNAGSQAADLRWTPKGVSAKAIAAQGLAAAQSGRPGPAVDTVTASPDGRWAAFTSVGNDAGGPVFLLNLKSGESVNLIDRANAVQGQSPLAADWWWDVIGWMPDSRRLVISPADISAAFIVDIASGEYLAIPLNAGGLGGGQFIGLSPDGSQLAYIAGSESGSEQLLNAYDLASKKSTTLVRMPISGGTLYYPRYAPDGRFVAYVVQKGRPETGLTYAIMLYGFDKKLTYIVAEGNLGLTVPTWSPDGQYLAFTRKNVDEPDKANPNKPFDQPGVNVWVASMTSGKLQQVTSINGTARRPVWSSDARTLSFITHDGQIGLVNVDQPGKIWLAAESSTAAPEFTSVFFIP